MPAQSLKNKISVRFAPSWEKSLIAIASALVILGFQSHQSFQKIITNQNKSRKLLAQQEHVYQCWSRASENLTNIMKDYSFPGAYYDNEVQCYVDFRRSFTAEEYELASQSVKEYVDINGLCNLKAPQSLIEVKKVEKDENLKLIGQWGAFARKDVTKMQCIGDYVGDLYLDDEFDQLSDTVDAEVMSKKYDYNMEVYIEETSSEDNSTTDRPLAYTIDGYFEDHDAMSALAFINDARMNISQGEQTENDKATQNTEFVYCKVNGFPFAFAITLESVKEGQQFKISYGSDYIR